MNKDTYLHLLKRFYWDLTDKHERQYYQYALIAQIPGLFGNRLRGRFLSQRFRSTGSNLRVFAGARFRSMENLVVGDNVEIGFDNFIQALGGVTLGDNVMLAPGVKIWSVNHNYRAKGLLVREQGQTLAPVVIGNDVWVAANAFISPGVELPDGVVVATGSVVGVKKYPPHCIIAGNPARVIGYREDEPVRTGASSECADENPQQATG